MVHSLCMSAEIEETMTDQTPNLEKWNSGFQKEPVPRLDFKKKEPRLDTDSGTVKKPCS